MRNIAKETAAYLNWMPEVAVVGFEDKDGQSYVSVRARDERSAIKAIDQAISLSVHTEHQHLVSRGAVLESGPIMDFRPEPREPLTHPWYFSTIISDRRENR